MAATTNIHGFNIGGNNNSFDQRGHFYRGVFSGNVAGMLVKQNPTPNMTVRVEHGSALLNKNTISASIAEIKVDTSVTIDTANTSNPRIDTVVIYEDTSIAIPTVEANYWQDGAGGRFKIVSLPGTAGASPVALSDSSIQSTIGAGKPWTRLADIAVAANTQTITNSMITDKRAVVNSLLSTPLYGYYRATGVAAPGEFNLITVKTFDVSSLPAGRIFNVSANNISGDGSGFRNLRALINYNSIDYVADNWGQYHNTASVSMPIQKVAGQDTVTIRMGGSASSQTHIAAIGAN